MKCVNTNHEGEPGPCGGTSFDVTTFAFFTLDVSGQPEDAIAELDGFHKDAESIDLTCRDCGEGVELSDARHQATVTALIRQEKRLGSSSPDFSSYTFQDGTVIDPDQIEQPALRDVTAGSAYRAALQHQERYGRWLATQNARIAAGEINMRDLHVMRTPWREAADKHLTELLAELAA